MGIFDNLKMATGLGLEPAEAYQRAFEKGVLLGPARFGDASGMFRDAAQKLSAVDQAMAARAHTNGLVYQFLATRDPRAAWDAVQALRSIPHIEVPGTADEIMEGALLAAELGARILEEQARAAESSGHFAVADARRRAAQAWLPLFRVRPVTFALTGDDSHAEDGQTRFFLNAGLAEMSVASGNMGDDPDLAAEHLAMAAQAFGRAGATELRDRCRRGLRSARLERPCWFCGRIVRGLGDNLHELPALSSTYFDKLARQDKERGEAWSGSGTVFACGPCAAAIDQLAQRRADEVRAELNDVAEKLSSAIHALDARLDRVESMAHRHVG